MRRHGELPREVGLQVRMVIALALSLALLLAIVFGLLYVALFTDDGWSFSLLGLGIVTSGAVGVTRKRGRWERRPAPKDARRRLRKVVQRLAVVADVPVPATTVIRYAVPLSWTSAPLGGTARVYVTTGLLDRLEDRELEAVVAHELGHLLHRDAAVMSLLAGPPAAFFEALTEMRRRVDAFRGTLAVISFGLLFGGPVLVLDLLSRVVSRHRELAADRAAALLCGSPAAVAAALVSVDEGLRRQRDRDLRAVAASDAFHFLPVRARRGIHRVWATHPPLRKRVERLVRLEAGMQR